MRKLMGVVLILLWLLASGVLWAYQLRHTAPPPLTGAVALNVQQAALLAYGLATLLHTLLSAYISVAFAGLLAGLWLLGDGLIRRARLMSGFGAAVIALEAALGLFTWLRLSLLLNGPGPASPITDDTVASGGLASVLIPDVLLLGLALGAILLSAPFARQLAGELAGRGAGGTQAPDAPGPERIEQPEQEPLPRVHEQPPDAAQ